MDMEAVGPRVRTPDGRSSGIVARLSGTGEERADGPSAAVIPGLPTVPIVRRAAESSTREAFTDAGCCGTSGLESTGRHRLSRAQLLSGDHTGLSYPEAANH